MSLTRTLLESFMLLISIFLKVVFFSYNFLYENFINSSPLYQIIDSSQDKFTETEGLHATATDPDQEDREKLQSRIVDAADIVEICLAHGYKIHEHVVQTNDGYLLAIHRIIPRKVTMQKQRSYSTDLKLLNQRVVYFHHGLLTNSELFVLGDSASKCLPFILLEQGYDVWLGNNRGNKYSRKHVSLSASSFEFWNYSLDEYLMHDIPNTIDYILELTSQKSLTYIGFSQGSAQCLLLLSLSPKLNDKINLFIGLSPLMIPGGLKHPLLSFFVNSAQSFLYKLFGRRAILPSVVFWQQLMGASYYKAVVDKSLVLLFGWKSENISEEQKTVGYQHMFSPSSVKSVVHWLQIIKNSRFQMYDEGGNAGSRLTLLGAKHKAHRVAPFPTQTIYTPMLLVYGTNDSLIDIGKTLDNLSCPVETIRMEGYEHMDTLWAHDVRERVFEPVLAKLREFLDSHDDAVLSPITTTQNLTLNQNGSGEVNVINLTPPPATTNGHVQVPKIIKTSFANDPLDGLQI